jgi:hypothetical protein
VGFEVLTEATTKVALFWNIALCNLVDGYKIFQNNVMPPFSGQRNTRTVEKVVILKKIKTHKSGAT